MSNACRSVLGSPEQVFGISVLGREDEGDDQVLIGTKSGCTLWISEESLSDKVCAVPGCSCGAYMKWVNKWNARQGG